MKKCKKCVCVLMLKIALLLLKNIFFGLMGGGGCGGGWGGGGGGVGGCGGVGINKWR